MSNAQVLTKKEVRECVCVCTCVGVTLMPIPAPFLSYCIVLFVSSL